MPTPGQIAGSFLDGGREPLSRRGRLVVLAAVIACHAGGGWALMQIEPARLVVGDVASMDVRLVSAEQPAAAPPEPAPPDLAKAIEPPPEPPPPPEVPLTDLATVVEPPPPDLPPPAFPVAATPPPPKPQPPAPKPPPPPKPAQARPQSTPAPTPTEAAAPAVPAAPAAPKTVSASQVGYLVPPNPVYPTRSRRTGEEGTTTVRVLVDIAGRPAQVSLQASSGHTALDESALSAVRAAQFRPYVEAGQAQAVWVVIPIRFKLQ